jgi:putative flippase GtrA
MLNQLKSNMKILWFLCIGGLNTLLGFGLFPCVYWLMEEYRQHYVWMLVVCHGINVLFAYVSNKYFVFRTEGQVLPELLKFACFHGFCLLMMLFFVPLFVEYAHLSPVLMQFSMSVLVVITSYFWYDKVVFLLMKSE